MIFSIDMIINNASEVISDRFIESIKEDYKNTGYGHCFYFEVDDSAIFCPIGMN